MLFFILKSVGIGLEIRQYRSLKLLVRTVLIQVKTPEQGLKSVGTYPSAFERRWYRSGDFGPIPLLFGAIPAVLQTLGPFL